MELGAIIKNFMENNELEKTALTYEQFDALEMLSNALVDVEYWGETMVYIKIV